MHDAYELFSILEKLPFQIEAISPYEGHLVVGTRQGHLLMYTVTNNGPKPKVSLLRSNKSFSKKPILQIHTVPEHKILISLSDQIITVHDLSTFNFLLSLQNTKGAIHFDVDIQHHKTLTGEEIATIRMVVCVKRNLQLYYWKGRQFQKLTDDIVLHDNPRSVNWCEESIAVAFKYDYWLYQIDGDKKELFATGRGQEPFVTNIGKKYFALQRDEKTVFVDLKGNSAYNYSLSWPEQPISMVHDAPYLIGIMSKNILVQSHKPAMIIQSIAVQRSKLIVACSSQKQLFVATVTNVWCLRQNKATNQIQSLIMSRDFELALQLTDLSDEKEKKKMKTHIEKLHALNLFCQEEYAESMKLFLSLDTDLLYVIGLFPGLVPEDYRSKRNYEYSVPQFSEDKHKEALSQLVDFLLKKRYKILKEKREIQKKEALNESPKKTENFLQIIDTTLLKTYLKINESLIVPLLRMPDSYVSIEEGERVLKQAKKYREILILFQHKGMHSRALQFLLRHTRRNDSPLYGHKHTAQYLQQMGPEHLDLIFEYCGWILKEYPEDGLKIFIGDDHYGEVEQFNRASVYSHLKKTNKNLIMPYLEHIIYEWKDSTPFFHNELINLYRDVCLTELDKLEDDYLQKCEDQEKVRQKLLKFLQSSKCYTAATLLVNFPFDRLLEERAVILGRLNQHHQALKIYIDLLDDYGHALNYCHTHYNKEMPGSQIYVILLNVLLQRSQHMFNKTDKSKNDITETRILNLLEKYSQYISLKEAINILPENVNFSLVKPYIRKSLYHVYTKEKAESVARGLSIALNVKMNTELVNIKKESVVLSDNDKCSVCSKRFTSSSAFAWFSNGNLVHFSCKEKLLEES